MLQVGRGPQSQLMALSLMMQQEQHEAEQSIADERIRSAETMVRGERKRRRLSYVCGLAGIPDASGYM